MSRRAFAAVLGALAVAAAAAPARAQLPAITPFSFEVRGGLAVPTGELNDSALATPGFTIGGSATYHAFPMVGLYVGYTFSRFGVEDEVSELFGDGHFTDQGLDAGVRVAIPTPLIPIDPWIRGGIVYHRLSLGGFDDPDFEGETDTSLGFEVGGGLGFGLGPFSLTPGVSFVRYNVDDDDTGSDATISYVKVDIGARIRL